MKIDYEILSLYKAQPEKEFSTSEIIEKIFPEIVSNINKILLDPHSSNEIKKNKKQELAKLQRKILHHLSSMVKKELLVVTHIENKGKKFYALAISEGEELVVDKFKRKLVIRKPTTPILPIGNLEELNLAYKIERNSFFDKVNAILIESTKFSDLDEFYEFIYSFFKNINDSIGLNDFEQIIQQNNLNDVAQFLIKLGEEAIDFNKRISCTIDFTNLSEDNKIHSFFSKYLNLIPDSVIFIFDLTPREFITQSEFIEILINTYSQLKRKLNFKNDDLQRGPYIVGKSGPYCLNNKEWEKYSKKQYVNSKGRIIAQSSIIIDVYEFFKRKPSASEFKKMILQISNALFFSSTFQKRNSFKGFSKLNIELENWQTFEFGKNIIRFWNYEIYDNDEENFTFLNTLREIKKEVDLFTKNQETIYLSCGMPTIFNISFGVAYERYKKETKLTPRFKEIIIQNSKDLYDNKFKNKMILMEKTFKTFDSGSEVRFFRQGHIRTADILREISIILNTYNLPFICYQFKNKTGIDMKLQNFFSD